jgi:hypothetical protein
MNSRPQDESSSPALDSLRDALYGAPLSEFLSTRTKLSSQLRAEGKKELAKAVLSLRKPNAVAWALNQLVRRDRELLAKLSDARAVAERAQARGDAAKMRVAIADYRLELDRVVRVASTHMEEAGASPTKEQLRNVRETLESAQQDPEGFGRELAKGWLVRGLGSEEGETEEVAFPEPAPGGNKVPASHSNPEPPSPSPAERAAALARERARREAELALGKATSALADAERRAAEARKRFEEAEGGLAEATNALREAKEKLEAARRAVPKA